MLPEESERITVAAWMQYKPDELAQVDEVLAMIQGDVPVAWGLIMDAASAHINNASKGGAP